MSADHDHSAHEEDHTGPIKTPEAAGLGRFLRFRGAGHHHHHAGLFGDDEHQAGAGAEAFTAEAAAARLAPGLVRWPSRRLATWPP